MRVLRVLAALFLVAAIYLLFTDRDKAAMVLVVAGSGLVMTDNFRVRARKPGGGHPG